MTALRITPPADEEGTNVEGAKEAEWAAVSVCGCFDRSWASLHMTIAASMAHMTEKWGDTGKEIEKWCRIHVITEGKMSLSRVVYPYRHL